MKTRFNLFLCLICCFALCANGNQLGLRNFEEGQNFWEPLEDAKTTKFFFDANSGHWAAEIFGDKSSYKGGIGTIITLEKGRYVYGGWVKGKLSSGSKFSFLSTNRSKETCQKEIVSSVDNWTYFETTLNIAVQEEIMLVPVLLEGAGQVFCSDINLYRLEGGEESRDYVLKEITQIEPAMIPMLSTKPKIDGVDSADKYKGAYYDNSFYFSGSGTALNPPVEMKVGQYDNKLYIYLKCDEPNPKQIISITNKERDGALWGGDFLSVFLSPDRSTYYQLIVNPAGYIYDEEVINGVKDASWDGNWEVKTFTGDNYWAAEFEIPFSEIGLSEIESGHTMYMNICRQRGKAVQLYSWSNVGSNFHQPDKFRPIMLFEDHSLNDVTVSQLNFSAPVNFGDVPTVLSLAVSNEHTCEVEIQVEAASFFGSKQVHEFIDSVKLGGQEKKELLIPINLPLPGEEAIALKIKLKDNEEGKYFRFIDLNFQATVFPKVVGFLVEETSEYIFWQSTGSYKIFPHTTVPSQKKGFVELSACRNETESFQIVVSPKKKMEDVEIVLSPFSGGGKQGEITWEIKEVENIKIIEATDRRGFEGLWPDPLVPRDRFNFEAGINNSIWFDIYVPEDTEPGKYLSLITVTGKNHEKFEIPVCLTVFDFSLPNEPLLRTAYGFWGKEAARLSEQEYDLYMQAFRQHRLSPFDDHRSSKFYLGNSIKVKEEGFDEFTLDFDTFDYLGEKYLDEYGFNSFLLHYPQTLCGASGFNNPKYRRLLKRYGMMVEEHLNEKGWLEKAYFYVVDEPRPNDFPDAILRAEVLNEAFPNIKRLITIQPEKELIGNFDIWVPCLGENYNKVTNAERKSLGEESWWYVCVVPKAPYPNLFIDEPGIDHRIRFWMAWNDGIEGDLYWNTVNWYSGNTFKDPWENPMVYPGANGDGYLFYPPKQNEKQYRTISSQRIALVRDGIEDYEYLVILEDYIREAEAKGVEQTIILEAQTILEESKGLINSYTEFASDDMLLQEQRKAIARMIEKIKKELSR